MSRNLTRPGACLTAALLLAGPAIAQQGRDARLFDSPFVGFDASDYFTARYTYASCVADLDGDGDPDVATVSWPNIARLTVLENLGAGMFDEPVLYTLPDTSNDVVAADFDGDGDADLVAANTNVNYTGQSVSLLRNRGDGTFEPPRTFATGRGPTGLAAADLDGDGDQDLAVANWGLFGSGNTVSVLLNDGTGTFAAPTHYPAGRAPHRLCATDLNGDGLPDLAVANGETNVSGTAALNVLINRGNGTFGDPVRYAGFLRGLSFFPGVAAADVDRDGDIDVLYADAQLNGFALFRNQGTGALGAPQVFGTTNFAGGPNALAVGDVTGDGWPDVVATLHSNQGWILWASAGGGGFAAAQRFSAAEYPQDIELADVEGDGDLDPIITNRLSLEVSVHYNPGNGDFEPHAFYPVTPIFSFFFDHGDIDGDGDLDIVNAGSVFEILRNRGDGTFPPFERYVPPSAGLDVKLRDLDGDGDLDLLWNEAGAPYRWGSALNDGTGRFFNGRMWPVPTCGYFRSEIDAFDLDNDGDLDVVQVESLNCVGQNFRKVYISENLGGGQFALANAINLNPNGRSVAGGDFDGDGNLDLAITGQPTTILMGNGDLTFTTLSSANVPGINIVTADFDRDGNLDLAIALQRNVAPFIESMVIQIGNGDGTFRAPVTYLGSHSPNLAQISEILTADVDRDEILDVMCMNDVSNDVSLWLGNGDGTFRRQIRYGTGKGSLDLAFADFTGDGTPDLATYDNTFPPLSTGIQIFAGHAQIPLCQPNVGFAGPGTAFLSVCGQPLAAGGASDLLLVGAPPRTSAFLGAALAANPLAVLGGTWVPNPIVLFGGLTTDARGQVALNGLPGGGGPLSVFVQFIVLDPAQPLGFAFSNAVELRFLP